MSKHRKQRRLPFVVEVAEPIGDDPVSVRARAEFHLRQREGEIARQADGLQRRLQELAEELWHDEGYWREHGLPPPTGPCPKFALPEGIVGVRDPRRGS